MSAADVFTLVAVSGLIILVAGVVLVGVGTGGRERRASDRAAELVYAFDQGRAAGLVDLPKAPPADEVLAGQRAAATFPDGSVIVGTVVTLRRGWLIVEDAERVNPDGSRDPLDGRAMISARHLPLIQLP